MQILIVDYGSQYTLVIGRTLRELGVRSAILPPEKASAWLKSNTPKGVILSGSNFSVHNDGAPQLPENFDSTGTSYPILGICYGMQLLAHAQGGTVERPHDHREYGPAKVKVDITNPLFKNVSPETDVWASHGDTVTALPKGFTQIATTKGIAGMASADNRVLGIQFHPEVVDSREGKTMLQNFLDISLVTTDWDPQDLIKEIQDEVMSLMGESDKAVLGVSGGVDSTTLVALLTPILGDKLVCVAIDTGGLRASEREELEKNVRTAGAKNFKIIDTESRFIDAISQTIDAEEKRAKFRDVYKSIFKEEIKAASAKFIIQGTLATDLIESGSIGESEKIKTHHNVGLDWEVDDLHPLRNLFKYEVRELGKALNLPKEIYERNPFPGPGLYLRVVGVPVSKEHLDTVRMADKTVTEILAKHRIEKDISQLVVALLGVKSVGVKGDERVYGHILSVRAVQTVDFMTATGYYFPEEVVREITSALTQHKEIVRVLFDMTPKPPATTEFE